MRQSGLWHPRLASLVVAMGHGDLLVVADPGLPVPAGVEIVDLVISRGQPGFMTALRPILDELVVEQATLAEELTDEKLIEDIVAQLGDTPLTWVTHEQLKTEAAKATAVVRTGEDTPYANIVLRAGVPF
ncbi:MAG TPA: D-ribose pyranase [Micromonosporaceae bacterium]|jgi:D-ribose pyranase